MLADVGGAAPADFEPPHVIAQIAARDQAGLGEVDEVAIDRRSIEAQSRYFPGDLAMAERPFGALQELQHRDPSGGLPEPATAQEQRVLVRSASDRGDEPRSSPRFGLAPCHRSTLPPGPHTFKGGDEASVRRSTGKQDAIANRLRHDATG